jgi:hypothetical protein
MMRAESSAVDRIVQEALALPVGQRADLVRRLVLSLDDSRPDSRAPTLVTIRPPPLVTAPAATNETTEPMGSDDEDLFPGPIASW